MTDGIFIAGACQGPKDIPAAVSQGAAAAARVQGLISQGQITPGAGARQRQRR